MVRCLKAPWSSSLLHVGIFARVDGLLLEQVSQADHRRTGEYVTVIDRSCT
jgi:hypothetical protein